MSTPPADAVTPAHDFSPPQVAVACPTCFGAIAVENELLGRAAACPLCGGGFRVPRRERGPGPQGNGVKRPKETVPADESITAVTSPTPARPPESAVDAEQHRSFDTSPEAGTAPDRTTLFQEPTRTIMAGDRIIALRRLSSEERDTRRTRRNAIMLIGGVSVLLAIVLLLGRKRKKSRSRTVAEVGRRTMWRPNA